MNPSQQSYIEAVTHKVGVFGFFSTAGMDLIMVLLLPHVDICTTRIFYQRVFLTVFVFHRVCLGALGAALCVILFAFGFFGEPGHCRNSRAPGSARLL